MASKTSNEKKQTDDRFRNFACVVYPESAPADWLTILSELKIPVMVSPLHDKDVNPDGEQKKPHYHVLMMFEGKKSPEQFEKIKESFGGVGNEIVQSIRGYARYLCHLDNPEKAQYSPAEIKCYGGADYDNICNLPSDVVYSIRQMQKYIRQEHIVSFAEFLDICSVHFQDWHYLLCTKCSVVISMYLKSIAWEDERLYKDSLRKEMSEDVQEED